MELRIKETCSSSFVIWLSRGLSNIKQFVDQVRIRLISQLINGISFVLQKLFRCFNVTIILTSFVSSFYVLPAIFVLNLNEALHYYQQENQ